jgi:hypothetical protein
MRIERHKNFLTQAECEVLNAWTDLATQKNWLTVSKSRDAQNYPKRVTSRLSPDRFEYPQFVLDTAAKIRAFCGVDAYPLIAGHGRNGIVVSCIFPGGDVYSHKDPRSMDGVATLRCNVMTRAADSGCVLHVGGEVVDVEAGELHCYLASEHEHFATPVEGSTSRVMWMFGAHVPAEDWDSGLIKVGE